MDLTQFTLAVLRTRTLLEAPGGHAIAAQRLQDTPCEPAHLSRMLSEALHQYAAGKREKANRWLGYVQGVISAKGWASLEELKRANMPEGETFDRERV